MNHDDCYGAVENDVKGCKGIFNEYLAPYTWNFTDNKVEKYIGFLVFTGGYNCSTLLQIVCSANQSGARLANLFPTTHLNQTETVLINL